MKIIIAHSKKHGDKEIFVDDCDYDLLSNHNWCLKPSGNTFYAFTNLGYGRGNKKPCKIHRMIMGLPSIDHKDGNGLNNQRDNLRVCAHRLNMRNMSKHKDGLLKFKGLRFRNSSFEVRICIDGKTIFVGRFKTDIEAAIAYNEAAIKYHGEFARLNVLP